MGGATARLRAAFRPAGLELIRRERDRLLTPGETRDELFPTRVLERVMAPRFIFAALSIAFGIAIIFAAVTTVRHLGQQAKSTKVRWLGPQTPWLPGER